ncbi:hypothetical protein [Prosthecomicrobium pneumaticum]|uniref:Uncharacterized protein n=1 Tax=Prosthecomicrobium pneumaticum TaxID=81895 RepID=A0A7W9L2X0_9HYPH|nr:hypothetical protein [Prosthecomicrobium pneumaticum]MBB5753906.1 hypothetical protein [Prosthecomicrobium pneumaticum]
MFSFLSRLLGLFALSIGVVALVVDGTRSIATSSLTLASLGQTWFSLSRDSLAAAQGFVAGHVEPHVGAWVWDPVVQFLLTLPTFAVFAALGALLILAGRRRRRAAFA